MLKINNLSAKIDNKSILQDFKLEINPGEVHAIMGPNGSGKSTLSNILSGKKGYDVTGEVLFENSDLFSRKEKIALKFTHLSSINPIQEDDQLKKRLLDEWSENDVIEIIGVIALFGFLNRWNDIMGTKLEDGAIEHSRNYLSDFGWEIGKHN